MELIDFARAALIVAAVAAAIVCYLAVLGSARRAGRSLGLALFVLILALLTAGLSWALYVVAN